MADFHAVNDANTRRVLAECPALFFFLPEDGVWEKYFVSCSRGLGQADIFCIFVQTTRAAKYKIYLAPAGERQGDIFYILLKLCAAARYKIYFAPPHAEADRYIFYLVKNGLRRESRFSTLPR